MPVLARRLNLPSAILEIAYGAMVFGLANMERAEWLPLFKELGLIYLMFVAGMELDIRSMMRQQSSIWLFMALLASFIAMPPIMMAFAQPGFLGIVVAVASAGVAIPVLKELSLMKSPIGKDVVNLTLMGEFISIAALTGLDIFTHHGLGLHAVFAAGKVFIFFALAVAFLRVMRLLAWWWPERVAQVMNSEDPVEEGIRAVMLVIFSGALIAVKAGVEPILGSFIAGVIFSYVFRRKGRFEEKVNAVGFGFLVPMFFIGVGADLDIARLMSSLNAVKLALLIAAMTLAARLPVLMLSLLRGRGMRESAAVALILSAPLSMMIVAGTVGVRAGLIEESYLSSIVLASIISSALYPSLFRFLERDKTAAA